jgi:hypothetical protein
MLWFIGNARAASPDSVKVRFALHGLLRQSAPSRHERYVFASTLVALIRSRLRLLRAVGWMVRPPLMFKGADKALLWGVVSAAITGQGDALSPVHQRRFWAAVKATQAYRNALARQQRHCATPFGRSLNYEDVRFGLRRSRPDRIVVFHHYDQRGFLPVTWLEALAATREAGWTVLLSTSALSPRTLLQVESAGIQLAWRQNVGLCLGAYKDLALLVASDPSVSEGVKSFVLCNDSNLLLQSPAAWLGQLQAWHAKGEASEESVLAGLTDSAQRACYHLQSFCLHANRALLQHPAWLRFWLGFSLNGSKDDLINHGEIGLSQALLTAGVQLRPAYPLVQGLLEDSAMAEELQRYGIWQPRHVNQSLFAWQSLLARGFPLVKKHVLFELIENQGLPMAMAELSRWIPPDRRALVAADLQELFVSRYSGGTPQLG